MERFDFAIKLMSLVTTDHVLEIGCGNGLAAARLLPLIPSGKLHLIDRSAAMVAKAAARLPSSVIIEQAEFPDWKTRKKFDKIFAFNVGSCWSQDSCTWLRAAAKLLKTDGTCWIFHQGPPSSGSRLNKKIRQVLKENAGPNGLSITAELEKKLNPSPVLAIALRGNCQL